MPGLSNLKSGDSVWSGLPEPREVGFGSLVFERLGRIPSIKEALVLAHFLLFVGLSISLFSVRPSPIEPLGYFSFELIAPLVYWPMLVALTIISVILVELDHILALPVIIVTMLAMRLPLLLMFKLPYHPDSYTYMGLIQAWRTTGEINLSLDLRSQYWPVAFLFLLALTKLGFSEIQLFTVGPIVTYCINALLIFLLLRRFLKGKTADYALLLISLAPTFNFYYYQVMSPQLIASTLFLGALVVLFAYESQTRISTLAVFACLFVLLLFTHHLTSLLLAVSPLVLVLGRILSRLSEGSRTLSLNSSRSNLSTRKLVSLTAGMLTVWIAYLVLAARDFTWRFVTILIGVLSGTPSTYSGRTVTGELYSIGLYAFNFDSVFVYGWRLLPLVVSGLLILLVAVMTIAKIVRSRKFSRGKLTVLAAIVWFAFLILVSIGLLKGLFLEVPRLFDLLILFASVLVADWFLHPHPQRLSIILRGASLLSLLIVSSTLGMAIHATEFVYYAQERDAVIFVASNYHGAHLYTDERMLYFAEFFAPNLHVTNIPLNLSTMLSNRTTMPVLILISYHSVVYDRYRPVFGHPPTEVLQFVEENGRVVYSNYGISVYLFT